ncbi:HAD family hydrolase [Duganella qianjiadongensis]|uniref:HAD-IB family hydrolase n=1 Tax=Duganella qianjiadongensis TaxID=2692176 RepID=A0ABW9VR43_9BURK|nr:HAD family hydrolase [Duganella qianjiadongensis]MYM41960.1 HAD-IB family hydrolase [Duganella qianjiadongensis]
MNLALFDLDHTLLPIDSDYEWGQFLVRIGAVDAAEFARRNDAFFAQYQAGTLDPVEYLEFSLGTLASFPRERLAAMQEQYMQEVVLPAIRPSALALLQKHRDAGDLLAIVTATNQFVTRPIAKALGVEHLIAAVPETDSAGNLTGKLLGTPTQGAGKVTHTKAWLANMGKQLEDFGKVHFYSDSHNDLPLMSIVSHPVATNPNAKLKQHAAEHGWPHIDLFND